VDDKVCIVATWLKNHVVEWGTTKNMQKPSIVANSIWVGFMKLNVQRSTPTLQDLLEGINLLQIRFMGVLRPMCMILTPK
jgi:hypothetical protein